MSDCGPNEDVFWLRPKERVMVNGVTMKTAKDGKKNTPKAGQLLYSRNIGNAARRSPQTLTPVTVTKVGRKYFTVSDGTQYRISDWFEKTEYGASSCLYETAQEYYDEIEEKSIVEKIAAKFKYGKNQTNISLRALRIIDRVISEDIQPNTSGINIDHALQSAKPDQNKANEN